MGILGGRAAEEVVYGTRTTGAESEIEQATHIARLEGPASFDGRTLHLANLDVQADEGAVRVEPTRLVVLSKEKLLAIANR